MSDTRENVRARLREIADELDVVVPRSEALRRERAGLFAHGKALGLTSVEMGADARLEPVTVRKMSKGT